MCIVLAEGGRAEVDIVVSKTADRVVRFAAKELRSYLKKISGADFRIIKREILTRTRSKPSIFITINSNPSDIDSFSIRSKDGHIVINGDKSRSALYGVYEFLEMLGCRFIEPGREIIPGIQKLSASPGNREYTAAFPLRNIFRVQIVKSRTARYEGLEPVHHLPQIDWMAKRRLNHYVFYIDYYRYDLWEKYKHLVLEDLLDRGFEIEVTHHSMHYFCPPDENHDYGGFGPSTYRSTHPDWYEGSQTKFQKPEVQAVIRERYLEYVERNPELTKIGIWPADAPMNASTDDFLRFWNTMGKALAEKFPSKQLSILSYFEILKPPEKIVPESNLHCWFCPISANYHYPMEEEMNRRNIAYMKAWIRKMPPERVACFEYYGWQSLLTPMGVKMKKDLTAYRRINLGGIYGWAGFTANILGTGFRWSKDFYVLSHLLWNPDGDVSSIETVWAEGVFGPAAKDILDFFETLKKQHNREKEEGLVGEQPWISLDLLHRVQKILASARRKAADSETARRIDLLERLAGNGCTEEVLREPRKGVYSYY